MTCNEIRKAFVTFFSEKGHHIVNSAPMVIKDDPTLMFTNAGMNQFKDLFLGNKPITFSKVANSQKCLRVSGKHNDLEEVGHDTYHHTMFEMLGNWSFGDYFKTEAITWAWEFLTEVLHIDKSRLYATIFKGDQQDRTEKDMEAFEIWKKFLPVSHILEGNKKDNFWEMGDTGPCGPCSEVHIDLRSENEIYKISGHELVNKNNPMVIEIWNLVFIQYNRKTDSTLELLPLKHVDTGMGFERLCRVIQKKESNYDIDIFKSIIKEIETISGLGYTESEKISVAMRVVADHLRAVAFSVADGQLPSNNKAGYVIRRILRRAIRYAYSYLNQQDPFIYKLVNALCIEMGEAYPELTSQKELIEKVIREEEISFQRTLANGIKLLDELVIKAKEKNINEIRGEDAFILYDTYGFPIDLTELILKEKNMSVSHDDFEKEMENQKRRSKNAAKIEKSDWVILKNQDIQKFIGYDTDVAKIHITRYRKVNAKDKELYQLVFDQTPFYAESGGQVGDSGILESDTEKISITDTIKENNLNIHLTASFPKDPQKQFTARINNLKRTDTANNHSATHLLHQALREVLGKHVEQKGSLVHPDYLRFDFSHFQKVTDEQIEHVERMVNQKIRENIPLLEKRDVPIDEALNMGAMALFGEKYGDQVRVVCFDDSVELCGGTHVKSTGQIGFFKITSESAIAAGIRRIEAVTGRMAEEYIHAQIATLKIISSLLKNQKDIIKAVENLQTENNKLKKQIENLEQEKISSIVKNLAGMTETVNDMNCIITSIDVDSAGMLKDLSFQLKNKIENLYMVLGTTIENKVNLSVAVSDNLVKDKNLNASSIIRELSAYIKGSGGGQPFFATAGGKDPDGIPAALLKAKEIAEKAGKENK